MVMDRLSINGEEMVLSYTVAVRIWKMTAGKPSLTIPGAAVAAGKAIRPDRTAIGFSGRCSNRLPSGIMKWVRNPRTHFFARQIDSVSDKFESIWGGPDL